MLAAVVFAATPLGTAAATTPSSLGGPTAPSAGTGPFDGIYAWGAGAPGCVKIQSNTRLTFDCRGIQRNFLGSYVLIRFPSDAFQAVLQLSPGQDPRQGLQWYVQETSKVPFVFRRGVIQGSETVTINPRTIIPDRYRSAWDLGLDDYPFQSSGPRVVNAEITIIPI
jgi:hypothetical protein